MTVFLVVLVFGAAAFWDAEDRVETERLNVILRVDAFALPRARPPAGIVGIFIMFLTNSENSGPHFGKAMGASNEKRFEKCPDTFPKRKFPCGIITMQWGEAARYSKLPLDTQPGPEFPHAPAQL